MSDTLLLDTPATDRPDGPSGDPANRPLTVKRIRRRAEQLGTLTKPGAFRRRRFALANAILEQIASGEIANPRAAARAYVESLPEEPPALTEVPAGTVAEIADDPAG